MDTGNVSAYAGLSILLIEEKKFDTCRILAEKGLKIDPYRSELYAILGNCELETGFPDKAIDFFRHCLRIDNTSLDAYLGLVAAFTNKDDHENALRYLNLAREISKEKNIRLNSLEDIERTGVTFLDKKKEALQKLLMQTR